MVVVVAVVVVRCRRRPAGWPQARRSRLTGSMTRTRHALWPARRVARQAVGSGRCTGAVCQNPEKGHEGGVHAYHRGLLLL